MGDAPASRIHEAHATLVTDGKLDAVGEFFAPDYLAHLTDRDLKGGYHWISGFLEKLRRVFPDLEFEVEILVEGMDWVAWQRTLRGTHQGDYLGFPASGRTVVWRDMVTSRFRDGLIAEEWVISDLAERLLLARKR